MEVQLVNLFIYLNTCKRGRDDLNKITDNGRQ